MKFQDSIVYEDDKIIAVNKPAGQLVIPGRDAKEADTLRKAMERHTKAKIYVVHRLDRGASGLVVFAKDPVTHRTLSMAFESRDVRKIYRVLVQGAIDRDGKVDKELKEFGSGRVGFSGDGKPASTSYRVLERRTGATLLEVEPTTGRRHQIRVHMFTTGHPVMGDELYGETRPVGGVARLMLHALSLELPGGLKLRAPVPPDFEAIVKKYATR